MGAREGGVTGNFEVLFCSGCVTAGQAADSHVVRGGKRIAAVKRSVLFICKRCKLIEPEGGIFFSL